MRKHPAVVAFLAGLLILVTIAATIGPYGVVVNIPFNGDTNQFVNGAGNLSTPAGSGAGPGAPTNTITGNLTSNVIPKASNSTNLVDGPMTVGSVTNIGVAGVLSANSGVFSNGVTSTGGGLNMMDALVLTNNLTMRNLTAGRAMVTDGLTPPNVTNSAVTATEQSYLSGVTSAIQTQLNSKAGTITNSFGITIDGGGSVIAAGAKGYASLANGGTITKVTMLADQSGSIVVDLYKTTYANFDAGSTHPVAGDKITASAPPTITTATKSTDSTLTGWTKPVLEGDVIGFQVTGSPASITRVSLVVEYTH